MTTFLLAVVFFVTSGISVVTGSTSVITVPVMLQLGIDPLVAVATNMFALTFMSVGGTIPFLQSEVINRQRLPALGALTFLGSLLGALLLLIVPAAIIPVIVSTAVIGLAGFSMVHRHSNLGAAQALPGRQREFAGYTLTFLLGVYGGLFSGGYVTILTTVFLVTFRMTLIEAIATTKVMNIVSSGIATIVFMRSSLVDYRLGAILALMMFAGAWLGAGYARRLSETWLRRIYLAAVWLLGLKTLIFDTSKGVPAPAPTPPGQ